MPSIISQVNYKSLDDVEFRLLFPSANSLPLRMTVFMMLCPGQNLFNFDFKINQRCLELLSDFQMYPAGAELLAFPFGPVAFNHPHSSCCNFSLGFCFFESVSDIH